jgi:multiple sugar transport system permease protein
MTEPRPWRVVKRALFYLSIVASLLFAIWPIFIGLLEGLDIDLGPLFSGQGITFIGGVPYYSGGFNPNIANLLTALNLDAYPRLVLNTVTIDVTSVLMALLAGIPAGYFLARSSLRGKAVFGYLILALRTASPFAIVIPLYLLFVQTGIWDTYFGVAVGYLVVDLPVVIWMLRGFFSDVPKELYEAAEVSGASETDIFRRVALPQIALGIVATAIFAFVLLWNEFLFADILTGGATKTVSVGIWTGAGENIGSFRSVEWDATNMLGILAFVPVFAIMLGIKKYLARGYSLSAAR